MASAVSTPLPLTPPNEPAFDEPVMYAAGGGDAKSAVALSAEREYVANKSYADRWSAFYEHTLQVRTAADYFVHIRRRISGNKPAIIDVHTGRSYSYDELNDYSNRVAHAAYLNLGLRAGSVVALMMHNCPHFLWVWIGLAKIGCTIACINTGLTDKALVHAVTIARATHVVVAARYRDAWNTAAALFPPAEPAAAATASATASATWPAPVVWWSAASDAATISDAKYRTLDAAIDSHAATAIPYPKAGAAAAAAPTASELDAHFASIRAAAAAKPLHLDDALFYIYTSGTTGPSKAARFSHRRFIGAGVTWTRPMRLTPNDMYYNTLPLFHGNGGVVAVSAVWHSGCTLVLREKFSVTNWWSDIRKHGVTATIYIGELWRYLHNQPPPPASDTKAIELERSGHKLRVIAGNGLRPDIWPAVVSRFGIRLVVEHYGMTEMPAGPYISNFNRIGACGFIPPSIRALSGADKIVKYDLKADCVVRTRASDGSGEYCVEVTEPDECGEVIFLLPPDRLPYCGYTDAAASARRVYRNVFKSGDHWFGTGDLLRCDRDGFFYFVDRAGDSFRWKGENVSTTDVSEVLTAFPGVLEANVYGVDYPGRGGRAGMAAILIRTADDTKAEAQHTDTKSGGTTAATATGSASKAPASTAASGVAVESSADWLERELDAVDAADGGERADVIRALRGFDLHAFLHHMRSQLASFAVPLFLRIRTAESAKTATLKFQKYAYQTDGFDPVRVRESAPADVLWFRYPNTSARAAAAAAKPSAAGATGSSGAPETSIRTLPSPPCAACGSERFVPLTTRLYPTIVNLKFPL